MHELDDWLLSADPRTFPYGPVVAEYHRVGKHFVAEELLTRLASARKAVAPGDAPARLLADFLETALDKHDGSYDYRSYLSLGVLPLPDTQDGLAESLVRGDRLSVQLIGDALRLELASAAGRTELWPEMRPDARTRGKRLHHGVRAVEPHLRRLGLVAEPLEGDPVKVAEQMWAAVEADLSPQEEQVLRLSILPVYISHDEYMFLRILQTLETAFASLVVQLRAVTEALAGGEPALGIDRLIGATGALREVAMIFPLLATMQVEAFRTFRLYTEGASAIQSRNYKTLESLCRVPDRERLDSAAYLSVPEVRARVLAGQATLDDTVRAVVAAGLLSDSDQDRLRNAMREFADTLVQWRRTHYRLAVRMLGEGRPGTGYTEGTPYLRDVRDIPVFRSQAAEEAP